MATSLPLSTLVVGRWLHSNRERVAHARTRAGCACTRGSPRRLADGAVGSSANALAPGSPRRLVGSSAQKLTPGMPRRLVGSMPGPTQNFKESKESVPLRGTRLVPREPARMRHSRTPGDAQSWSKLDAQSWSSKLVPFRFVVRGVGQVLTKMRARLHQSMSRRALPCIALM